MNCFVHSNVVAVGMCVVCQKATCRDCVTQEDDPPRLICRACKERGGIVGFEYKSEASIGKWPLLHICAGMDPATMRPKVARGVIAIGSIAIGGVAFGGITLGLVTFGGISLGCLLAIGGMALGLGLSFGGLAVGSIAIGGGAVGFFYAVGGGAIAPSFIDGHHCDPTLRDLVIKYGGKFVLPPTCKQ